MIIAFNSLALSEVPCRDRRPSDYCKKLSRRTDEPQSFHGYVLATKARPGRGESACTGGTLAVHTRCRTAHLLRAARDAPPVIFLSGVRSKMPPTDKTKRQAKSYGCSESVSWERRVLAPTSAATEHTWNPWTMATGTSRSQSRILLTAYGNALDRVRQRHVKVLRLINNYIQISLGGFRGKTKYFSLVFHNTAGNISAKIPIDC